MNPQKSKMAEERSHKTVYEPSKEQNGQSEVI